MSEEHKHSDHDCCGHEHYSCGHAETPRDAILKPEVLAGSQTTLRVAGMDCADEVESIQRALKPLAGVREVRVNLMGGKVVVAHNQSVTSEKLMQAIAGAGLKATPDESGEHGTPADAQRSRLISVAASGVLTGVGLILQWTKLGPSALSIGIFAAAIVSGGWFILPKAIRALRRFALDMNVLMTVAVIGAAAIGEWSEGAAVAFLFALSELLEAFSLNRARKAIKSLLDLSPVTALRKEGSEFREVGIEEVKADDIVAVKSGMKVPLDGVVTVGESSINQAPITGESMPVEKKPGDTVFAGTINGEGSLEIRVTKIYSETTLARIIHLVEEGQSQKAPSQQFVDKFARYYTPSVFVLALGILLVPTLALNVRCLRRVGRRRLFSSFRERRSVRFGCAVKPIHEPDALEAIQILQSRRELRKDFYRAFNTRRERRLNRSAGGLFVRRANDANLFQLHFDEGARVARRR